MNNKKIIWLTVLLSCVAVLITCVPRHNAPFSRVEIEFVTSFPKRSSKTREASDVILILSDEIISWWSMSSVDTRTEVPAEEALSLFEDGGVADVLILVLDTRPDSVVQAFLYAKKLKAIAQSKNIECLGQKIRIILEENQTGTGPVLKNDP